MGKPRSIVKTVLKRGDKMQPYSPHEVLWTCFEILACLVIVPFLFASCALIETVDVTVDFWKTVRKWLTRSALIASVISSASVSEAGVFRRVSHAGLVAASGIRPNQIGTHEGVGMSSRGYIEARNIACYWGQRQAISVQYSKRGGMFYAVVRYR